MDTIILGRVGGWTDGGGVDELVRAVVVVTVTAGKDSSRCRYHRN